MGMTIATFGSARAPISSGASPPPESRLRLWSFRTTRIISCGMQTFSRWIGLRRSSSSGGSCRQAPPQHGPPAGSSITFVSHMRRHAIAAALLTFAAGTSCRAMINYQSSVAPRYAAALPLQSVALDTHASLPPLRVVTLNLKYARQVERAIYAFQSYVPLRGADVIMLQEMDAPATQRIAAAMGMAYVYYPAGVHPRTHRDFGNAILSRWPIITDRKLILPHLGRLRHGQRIATVANIRVGNETVRLYRRHLGPPSDMGGEKRRDQARVILQDATTSPLVIVVPSGRMTRAWSRRFAQPKSEGVPR